jgi:rubrerythrin
VRVAWSALLWWTALGGLALLAALQAVVEWRDTLRRRRERKQRLFCCAACGFVYLGRGDGSSGACPRCGRPPRNGVAK